MIKKKDEKRHPTTSRPKIEHTNSHNGPMPSKKGTDPDRRSRPTNSKTTKKVLLPETN